MTVTGFRVSAYEGKPTAIFYGPGFNLSARVFRGRVGRELALGLRGLESPPCARELQPGWYAEVPDRWYDRNNKVERRLFVFRSPNAGVGETVLEFERPIPELLERAIIAVFMKKEMGNGQQEQRRTPEAHGQVQPVAPGGRADIEGLDRRRRDHPGEQD